MVQLPPAFKNLVNELGKLPGIGPKSATRLALFLVTSDKSNALVLASSILRAKETLNYCKLCGGISDGEYCEVCSSNKRNKAKICVVETVADMIAVERAGFFDGVYHVLGGLISPLDDIDEEKLNIKNLISRIDDSIEVIFALPSSLEADATILLIKKLMGTRSSVKLTRVATGIPAGSNLDYADSVTLMRSFENRVMG